MKKSEAKKSTNKLSDSRKKDIVKVVNERFEKAYKKHEEFMSLAARCQDFVFGKQWRKEDLELNEANRKPSLTINITLSTLNAMFTAYTDLEADIATKSRNDSGHDESILMNKVLKQVLYDNGFSDEEADAFLEAATTGRAWFDLRVNTIENPLGEITITLDDYDTIVLSLDAEKYDPDTWPEIFYYDEYTKDEFEAEFGATLAGEVEFDHTSDGGHTRHNWLKKLRNIGEGEDSHSEHDEEAFLKTLIVTREHYEYQDAYAFVDPNTQVTLTEYASEFDNEAEAKRIANESGLLLFNVKKKRIIIDRVAGDVLVSSGFSPYKHFTKIPLFAYFARGRTMGGIEPIISPQEQLNKSESQELHIIGSTANSGYNVEEDSLVNMTPEQLERKGGTNGLVVVYRRGTKAPEKVQPNSIPTAITHVGGKSKSYIREISGINDGMVGITRTNDSNKLLENKKQSGQALLQRILKNLNRTRRIIGRNIIDIIQEYYTEPRVLRYSPDNEELAEELKVNQIDAAGRIVNDLSLGKYDLVVTSRPRKDVLNDYEADMLIRMQDAGADIPPWMIVSKSQLTDKKELVAHLRRKDGLDLTPQEQQKQELLEQIEIATLQLDLQEKQAKIGEINSKTKLNEANVFDIIKGSNYRFATGLLAEAEMANNNNALRERLAVLSSDTTVAKEAMKLSQQNTDSAPRLGELPKETKEKEDV